MLTFQNQSFGSFDDNSHEYVEVSFDETQVARFAFHSIMVNSGGRSLPDDKTTPMRLTRQFGIQVEARYVFQACADFHTTTNIAIAPDGHEFFVTQTWSRDGKTQEIHAGDRFGRVIARMRRTGYVQEVRTA